MDVILPVAGLGTRLRPHTWSKPKPLVPVAGKPMLEHVLDRVVVENPEKLVFITGYRGDQIEEWARATYDISLEFVEQPEMLGQTDAIVRTRDAVKDDALILFPDMLFEADFSGLPDLGVDGVAYTKEIDDPSAYGVAVLNDKGNISRLVEKPSEPVSNLAVIGIYYIRHMADLYDAIDRQIEQQLMTKGEYFLADALQIMIDDGKSFVTRNVPVWEDCGNSEALLQTNRYLLDNGSAAERDLAGGVVIQPSVVHAAADIRGSIVGPYASIHAGATIRNSVITDAIVQENAIIENAVVDHSMIGEKAEIHGTTNRLDIGDNAKVTL
ncbi:MAG TPA: sugar phosphate nucleotidyltransferase [Thermomicrobiales bacterium]|nr:sugar phosphate nucleotidyltransferase [Thermomicrobiales bacterium]